MTAEFWGHRDGLVLAEELGIQSLIIELDAKVILQLLEGNLERNFIPSLFAATSNVNRNL